jgi:type I restriction enzyme M protein
MLDTDTKRRIDTARDILVGKVPDPKSQVEQITIALIYKFMDDMDAEAEELGGKRKFFTGNFAGYGWAQLMRAGLGGHEMLGLYAEGIAKMPENPGIPPLFRDIFKNAYLPYRDPETLKAFLKIIDEFIYDHSERLGDAFEYLLSVLGSQGDAGQFRTPRHIIDFIVEILDPKKNESVLDPACGTAGFLISAYKHILKTNSSPEAVGPKTIDENDKAALDSSRIPPSRGDMLTPDERGKLATNFKGYDISPDMVRLSLVNLYLHGFTDPHIYEYDTLTSEERWNEFADVILANPPFMSPKGGIKPHRRFSIQAKRSEVLFVDYIAEHLTPSGRAGIIVPEGVIFQSQTAYTELRRMLVENSLVAVVSLPAGCFNPYSGVKTSILILDKSVARQSNTIGFFKIMNDGFGLGAQRRPIDKNDLPQVQAELSAYLHALHNHQPIENLNPTCGLIVPKGKIAASDDYNLNGDRYGDPKRLTQGKWSTVSLGEICTFMTGGTPTSSVAEYYENGTVPWLVSGDIHRFEIRDCEKRITPMAVKHSNAKVLPKDSVLIALNGQGRTRGTVALLRMNGATCNQSLVAITPADPPRAISEFIFWVLRSMYFEIRALTGDNERSGLNIPILKSIKIPLPPLEIQKEFVAEIEGYQKVIDGARAVLEHYRPHIPIHPNWPTVPLEKICEIQRGKFSHRPRNDPRFYGGKYPFIQTGDVVRANGGKITFTQTLNEEGLSVSKLFQPPIVVVTIAANIGDTAVLDFPSCFPDSVVGLIPKPGTDARYLEVIMRTKKQYLNDIAPQAAQKNINIEILKTLEIPFPPLVTQQGIVAEIEAEQTFVAANRKLVIRFEEKIQATIARIWSEEVPFAPEV